MTDTSTEAVERLFFNLREDADDLCGIVGIGYTHRQRHAADTLRALAAERGALKAELHEARMQAIVDFGKLQKACDERNALKAEVERLRKALTPSGDTKAAYMGEIECDCPAVTWRHDVPWVSIKAIMAMIRDRAALQENTDD